MLNIRKRITFGISALLIIGGFGLFWTASKLGWIGPEAATQDEKWINFGPERLKEGTLDNLKFSDRKAAIYLAPEE